MPLIGALYTALICLALGRLFFKPLRDHNLLAAFAGAPILSLAVFLLSSLGLARTPVFLAFAPLLWFLPRIRTRHFSRVSPLFLIPYIFYAVIYLANSLAPEHSPDGMAYHLGLVARWLTQHGFIRDTTNMYGLMPQGMEMLYLFAFSLGRHSAAATVHCLMLLALPWLIYDYARRTAIPTVGITAAMLVFLSPLAGIDGVSAYNDIALAASAFAMFALLELWREDQRDRLLIPAALLAGFCFAIKYTGFAAALYFILVVRRRLRPIHVAAAAAIALPWLLRNYLWTGNPVAPLFNATFRNPFVHISFENFYRGYFHTYNLPSLKPLFRMLTVTGELGGQLGPLFLLTPLGLLAFRTPQGRRILLALACFLIPYPANLGARFLLPVLPFAALSIALALPAIQALSPALIALAAVLAWPRIIDRYRAPAGGWQIATVPWQAALGFTPAETWLRARVPEYATAELINRSTPQNAVIWSTNVLPESYIRPKVMVNYYSAQGESIEDTLNLPLRDDLQPLWRHRFRFPPSPFIRLRLTQLAQSDTDIWSIGEIRFYLGETAIRPQSANANPFPWDINLVLDQNPTTRWRAWEPLRRSQFTEFTFPPNTQLDRVEIDSSHDQWKLDLRLEGLPTPVEILEAEPLPDLRGLAIQTIKSRGISHLFIGRDYPTARDMRTDPARWGLTLAAENAGDALYRIQ